MNVKQIYKEIEQLFPPALAQDWDNVGLLVGNCDAQVSKILMTIDVTKDVVAEASRLECEMILSYHPVIWQGLKSVTSHGPGEVVHRLIRENIAVYSIHTSLDVITDGVNDHLAEMVGIVDARAIGDFVSNPDPGNYKLIVFVPLNAVNKVAEALYNAGAGAIGNYSMCSFQTNGIGTFKPLKGSSPAIGTTGKLQKVDEVRLEVILPADKAPDVVDAMKNAHPYEMPAFDLFKNYQPQEKMGLGRMGKLKSPRRLKEILADIKKATGANVAGIIGKPDRLIRKAAVCAGSCGKIINNVIQERCDLYLTGELKHHHALAAAEANITAVCLSHTVSERFMLKKIAKNLQKKLKNVKITTSKKDKDPFNWTQI